MANDHFSPSKSSIKLSLTAARPHIIGATTNVESFIEDFKSFFISSLLSCFLDITGNSTDCIAEERFVTTSFGNCSPLLKAPSISSLYALPIISPCILVKKVSSKDATNSFEPKANIVLSLSMLNLSFGKYLIPIPSIISRAK